MSHAINPKGPRVYAPATGPMAWVNTFLFSSVGQKILVALSGSGLVVFLVFHMIGNLKVFSGQESLNKYAAFLKHDLGALIWIARAGLLGMFGLHLIVAIRLQWMAKAARPIGYVQHKTAQASIAAKTMIWTGLVTLAFVIFHLAHFTFGWVQGVEVEGSYTSFLDLKDSQGHADVYRMVVVGFQTPWVSAIYIVCQILLFIHLSHGIASSLQTLGLVGKRFAPAAVALGYAVAGIVFVGNLAIVVAIWTGYVK